MEQRVAGVIGGGGGAAARAAGRARAPRPRAAPGPPAPLGRARGPAPPARAAAPRPATRRLRPVRRASSAPAEPLRPHLSDGLGLLLRGQRAAHGGLGQQLLGGQPRVLRAARALRARVFVQRQGRLALLVRVAAVHAAAAAAAADTRA